MGTQLENTGIITLGLVMLAYDKAKDMGTKIAHTAEEKFKDREHIFEQFTMQMRNKRNEMGHRMTEEMQKLKRKWHFGPAEA